MIAFVLSFFGLVFLADWQSVGGDPCVQLTHGECLGDSVGSGNGSLDYLLQNNSCSVFHDATVEELFYNATSLCGDEQCVCDVINNVTDYQCFWNPLSRVTGQYCERCRRVCLSEAHSLNFAQFIVGTLVFAPGYPMGRIALTVLASDGLGAASQVLERGGRGRGGERERERFRPILMIGPVHGCHGGNRRTGQDPLGP